jgi:hypothetical protein
MLMMPKAPQVCCDLAHSAAAAAAAVGPGLTLLRCL